MFNVKRPMQTNQIAVFAADFCGKYIGESFEDILMFFKAARLGEIKNDQGVDIIGGYESIDGQQLFDGFGRYLELKSEWREEEHKKAKEAFSRPFNLSQYSEEDWEEIN